MERETAYIIDEMNKLGISLTEQQSEQLYEYYRLLVEWNSFMNLTGITEFSEVVQKHFVDSLSIVKVKNMNDVDNLIDVGTGAGFPGLPLLIARPDLDLTLADSLHKRLVFLKDVLHGCGLVAERVHARAEILGKDPDYREQYDIATARAVAPLPVLCEYCLPFVKVGGAFLALKGAEDEVAAAKCAIATLGGELEQNVSYKLPSGDSRHLVVVRKISQTPTKYPRKPKKIDIKPL
ncbi:MAG: 16S rRNA (guanine(527)-N(7))-methyltransferase RsmG [Clostridium sp. CAG:217_53_7]|nr:MAG: 16S rRNA (guanine(527)-N(7))-methyltransferase RsmG [Clostridium sp. CAG:217_53_7]